jgi:hypothetical protein
MSTHFDIFGCHLALAWLAWLGLPWLVLACLVKRPATTGGAWRRQANKVSVQFWFNRTLTKCLCSYGSDTIPIFHLCVTVCGDGQAIAT